MHCDIAPRCLIHCMFTTPPNRHLQQSVPSTMLPIAALHFLPSPQNKKKNVGRFGGCFTGGSRCTRPVCKSQQQHKQQPNSSITMSSLQHRCSNDFSTCTSKQKTCDSVQVLPVPHQAFKPSAADTCHPKCVLCCSNSPYAAAFPAQLPYTLCWGLHGLVLLSMSADCAGHSLALLRACRHPLCHCVCNQLV